MSREQWTRKVREDSNGQKTVTIPKNADIEDGDNIKFKKTERYDSDDIKEAFNQAIESFDSKQFDQQDWATPDTVEITKYVCKEGEGRDMCMIEENSLRDLARHMNKQHDRDVRKEDLEKQKDYGVSVSIQKMFLQHGVLREFLQHMDIENKDLYKEDVAERLEEIVNYTGAAPKDKLEMIDQYIEDLRE